MIENRVTLDSVYGVILGIRNRAGSPKKLNVKLYTKTSTGLEHCYNGRYRCSFTCKVYTLLWCRGSVPHSSDLWAKLSDWHRFPVIYLYRPSNHGSCKSLHRHPWSHDPCIPRCTHINLGQAPATRGTDIYDQRCHIVVSRRDAIPPLHRQDKCRATRGHARGHARSREVMEAGVNSVQ